MIIGASQSFGENVKHNQFLSKPRGIVWPSRSALSLALFLRTPSDEALWIARWLATAHDDADAQRTHAQEQLERHTLARCTHRLPPILSRAPTRMDDCPQQLLPDRTRAGILKMAAGDGIYNRNSVKSTCVFSSVVFTYTSLTLP